MGAVVACKENYNEGALLTITNGAPDVTSDSRYFVILDAIVTCYCLNFPS
jgi:hypothetical protein